MATLSAQARALRKEIKRWQKDGSAGWKVEGNECQAEPKPAKCRSPHAKWGNWRYCPLCGVALTKGG